MTNETLYQGYTCDYATNEGMLFDATCEGKLVGFDIPIVMTLDALDAAHTGLVGFDIKREIVRRAHVLRILADTWLFWDGPPDCIPFAFDLKRGAEGTQRVELKAVRGFAADGSPFLIIMTPAEEL